MPSARSPNPRGNVTKLRYTVCRRHHGISSQSFLHVAKAMAVLKCSEPQLMDVMLQSPPERFERGRQEDSIGRGERPFRQLRRVQQAPANLVCGVRHRRPDFALYAPRAPGKAE